MCASELRCLPHDGTFATDDAGRLHGEDMARRVLKAVDAFIALVGALDDPLLTRVIRLGLGPTPHQAWRSPPPVAIEVSVAVIVIFILVLAVTVFVIVVELII